MSNAYRSRLAAEVEQLTTAGLRRELERREGPQAVAININGRALVNFSSNDYLALANDAQIVQRVADCLPQEGFGTGAAALLSGRCSAHAELEQRLLDYTGAEAVLLFSSGYLANLGALPALIKRSDLVAHDRLNHASLIDGVLASGAAHRRYPHQDMDRLATLLGATATEGTRFIVSESLYSMDGDSPDLIALDQLAALHEAVLYIDDAHGFGVMHNGRGAAGLLPPCSAAATTRVVMLTFGKALGSAGAAVLGPAAVIDYLTQRARTFIYDTALPAVCAVAALAALERIIVDPGLVKSLAYNVQYFRRAAASAGLNLLSGDGPIQPILIGAANEAMRLAQTLQDEGYYVRAIRPPTVPAGTARLRITLSAGHNTEHIDGLISALAEHVKETAHE